MPSPSIPASIDDIRASTREIHQKPNPTEHLDQGGVRPGPRRARGDQAAPGLPPGTPQPGSRAQSAGHDAQWVEDLLP